MWVGMLVSSVSAAYWRRWARLSSAGAGRWGMRSRVDICGAKVYVVVDRCVVLLCARCGGGGRVGGVGGHMLVNHGCAFM